MPQQRYPSNEEIRKQVLEALKTKEPNIILRAGIAQELLCCRSVKQTRFVLINYYKKYVLSQE